MKLYFSTEGRFIKNNGVYYSLGGFSQTLWDRYLRHFDSIVVIARVLVDNSASVNEKNAIHDPRVSFMDLPYYVGLTGFFRNKRKLKLYLKGALQSDGVYICRVPGTISSAVIQILRNRGFSYACEVVGDPWDVFAPGSMKHIFRGAMRIKSTLSLKSQLRHCNAALYVTQKKLQNRYPVSPGVFNIGASDVILKESTMAYSPKVLVPKEIYNIISIGSLAQMYKSPDIVLKAISSLKNKGIICNLTWLGGGMYLESMRALAEDLGVSNNVFFLGNVSSEDVINQLRRADMFILASRTEGLPRALIEAMSQGLPCVGTRVGGIPELLDECVLVEKDSVRQLSDAIKKMVTTPLFANAQAERNLLKSRSFLESELDSKRESFYRHVKLCYETK